MDKIECEELIVHLTNRLVDHEEYVRFLSEEIKYLEEEVCSHLDENTMTLRFKCDSMNNPCPSGYNCIDNLCIQESEFEFNPGEQVIEGVARTINRVQWDKPIKYRKSLSKDEIIAKGKERRESQKVRKQIMKIHINNLEQDKHNMSEEAYEDELTKLGVY
tara:strand:+ start:81 stop:563 length:483 start_codon:yes stop_codon:yes gene_type:complete